MHFKHLVVGILFFTTLLTKTDLFSDQVSQQAKKIYKNMSLDQKIGLLILPTYRFLATSVSEEGVLCKKAIESKHQEKIIHDCGLDQIAIFHIGAVLQDGGPYYNYPSLKNWRFLNDTAQRQHQLNAKDNSVLLIGNDTIHGNNHVAGAVIFPHNINLGVTHDPELVKKIAELTGKDSLASGFNWAYMPTVAIAEDLRWGRTYESFGQDPKLVHDMAKAYISGMQGANQGPIATAKHFIGDGATQYGLDEGDAIFSGGFNQFMKQYGAGYEGALKANVHSIMVSYNAINSKRMHFGGDWNILNRFKQDKFSLNQGFVVSDYNGATRAAYFYNQKNPNAPLKDLKTILAKSFNAGVDMFMIGNGDQKNPFNSKSDYYCKNIKDATNALKAAYKEHLITDKRLEEAGLRILIAKQKLPKLLPLDMQSYLHLQKQQRSLALDAAQKSLVLLKNESLKNHSSPVLPIAREKLKNIILIGDANDLGMQNGGWTINWQGQKGNEYFRGEEQISSGASTIKDAVLKLPDVHVLDTSKTQVNLTSLDPKSTIAIAVIGEPPYAEYMGDIGNPYEKDLWYNKHDNIYMPLVQSQVLKLEWKENELQVLHNVRSLNIPVITVVFSGRPIILSEGVGAPLNNTDALIAAFLPGTLGGDAIVNAVVGNYRFRQTGLSNTLTFPWPRNMEDVNTHFKQGSLFPIGFGLSTTLKKNALPK